MFESTIFKLEYPANWDDLYSLVESGVIKEVDISIMTLKEEIGFFRPGIRYDSFIQFKVLDAKEESLKGMLYRSPIEILEYHNDGSKSMNDFMSILGAYHQTGTAKIIAEKIMAHGCKVKFDGNEGYVDAIREKMKIYDTQISDLFKLDESLVKPMMKAMSGK